MPPGPKRPSRLDFLHHIGEALGLTHGPRDRTYRDMLRRKQRNE